MRGTMFGTSLIAPSPPRAMPASPSPAVLSVGMPLFPGLTQLDLTGPYEVLARMPDTRVSLVASTLTPVRTEWGLTLVPDATFDDAPEIDVLCVPGGWGVDAHLEDAALLGFLRTRGERARYVTSVCSGALLLGAAGLFGEPVAQRIQLAIEYRPAPPFDSGSPRTAPEHVRAAVVDASRQALTRRRAIVERAARLLR